MTTLNRENWSKELFLLDNLFHTTDVWNIVLEFIGVGRSIFYKSHKMCDPWDCDKKIYNLSSHGRGIGCVNKNAGKLLNRRSVHIDDALWAIGQSCKYMYVSVYDFEHSLECKKFIITNNLLYKIEMIKHYEKNQDKKKCEMISLCEAYRRVFNGNDYMYPNSKARIAIEDFIYHDCEEFNGEYESNAHKFHILMNEPCDILNSPYKFDENYGWYKPIIKCKGCLKFLQHSPICYSHKSPKNSWPMIFVRPHKIPVYIDKTDKNHYKKYKYCGMTMYVDRYLISSEVDYFKTIYVRSKYRNKLEYDSEYCDSDVDYYDNDYDSDF